MKNSQIKSFFKAKRFFAVVFMMMIALTSFAQTKSISGNVTDSKGLPLPGVTVVVKGTTQGTLTNADGNYDIQITPPPPLF